MPSRNGASQATGSTSAAAIFLAPANLRRPPPATHARRCLPGMCERVASATFGSTDSICWRSGRSKATSGRGRPKYGWASSSRAGGRAATGGLADHLRRASRRLAGNVRCPCRGNARHRVRSDHARGRWRPCILAGRDSGTGRRARRSLDRTDDPTGQTRADDQSTGFRGWARPGCDLGPVHRSADGRVWLGLDRRKPVEQAHSVRLDRSWFRVAPGARSCPTPPVAQPLGPPGRV